MERGVEKKEEKAPVTVKEATNEPSSLVRELRRLLCNDRVNLNIITGVIVLLCVSCVGCYYILDEK